jgi:hypothetical protein
VIEAASAVPALQQGSGDAAEALEKRSAVFAAYLGLRSRSSGRTLRGVSDDSNLGESLDADGINRARSRILEAYFFLRQRRDASQIGATDILVRLEQTSPELTAPSPSLIVTTLREQGLIHRGRGRPRVETPPFLRAVRPAPPKAR